MDYLAIADDPNNQNKARTHKAERGCLTNNYLHVVMFLNNFGRTRVRTVGEELIPAGESIKHTNMARKASTASKHGHMIDGGARAN